MEPSFFLSYWRPWNENSSLFDSWGDYLRNTSLTDYAVSSFGRFVKESSQDIVNAIETANIEANIKADKLIAETKQTNQYLSFINRKIDMAIEQQRMTNLALLNIADILKIPDSEKERQHCITLGIKFLSNASKDPDLYEDALSWFHKAEQLQPQDYFVLHRLGMIYLYGEGYVDLEKAQDYFIKAGKYASVESEEDAKRLVNLLTNDLNKEYSALGSTPSAISNLASDSYGEAALACYIQGNYEKAENNQEKAYKLVASSKNTFYYLKYLCRSKASEKIKSLLPIVTKWYPELVEGFFSDLDIISSNLVLDYISKLINEENNKSLDYVSRLSNSSFHFDKDLVLQLSSEMSYSERKRLNKRAERRVNAKQPVHARMDKCEENILTKEIKRRKDLHPLLHQVIVNDEGIVTLSQRMIYDHLSDQMKRLGATYCILFQFKEGLARVRFEPGGLYGFLDEELTLKIPAKYEDATDFSEGLAVVTNQKQKMFIDKNGDVQGVCEVNGTMYAPSEGMVCLCKGGDEWSYFDLRPIEQMLSSNGNNVPISTNMVPYRDMIPEMHAGYVLFEYPFSFGREGIYAFSKEGKEHPLTYEILNKYESYKLKVINEEKSKVRVAEVAVDYPEGTFLYVPQKKNLTSLPFNYDLDKLVIEVQSIFEKGVIHRNDCSHVYDYDRSINALIRMGLIKSDPELYDYELAMGSVWITLSSCRSTDFESNDFNEIKAFIEAYQLGDVFHSNITKSSDVSAALNKNEKEPLGNNHEKSKDLVTKKAEIELDDALLEAPAKIYVSYLIQVLRVTNSMQQVRSRGYYIVTESEVEKSFEEMLSDEKYKKLLHLRGEKNAIEISPDKIESLLLKKGIFIKNEQSNDGSYQMPTISTEQAQDIIEGKLSINDITKSNKSETTKKGCYIATCIYGSYDCPEVWTLRRYRDQVLRKSAAGRLFIRVYYATSPTLVRWFGDIALFRSINRNILDKWISTLRIKGFSGAPYRD